MKLLRFRSGADIRAGALVGNDGVVDITTRIDTLRSVTDIIEGGAVALDRVRGVVEGQAPDHALDQVALLNPFTRVGKYLAIGLNYKAHVDESRSAAGEPPKYQYWFNKQTSCLSGPFDPIDPGVTEQLDYEVELGVVIGRAAKSVAARDTLDHVFGYFVANDVSARDWQFHAPSFTVGKSFDTFGPVGPWVVTADEIPDPHCLGLSCSVNGELRQSANTSEMIFDIRDQIEYLSTAMTLEPGDLLATGTPAGVGMAMKPPGLLNSGDVVRCEIDGIGAIENRVL